ncbi:Crp/Fnr family transcriptional regulator [Desulfosarcina sp. OttesenSCG-928-A07]|nr:Crp/Fnr family transcriptional regulator [Desulfosarcina sp. OttesenSCG-928-G17]MDL2328784.1 Crp/Fnr family transcriptional regulator [Desulfosarcina sp. OttesenSCG-928-A07]
MDTTRQILSETPLFNGLSAEEQDELAAISVGRPYGRGELIFMEGDPADGFYLVARGRVKIFKTALEGKELILHIYGPGNPFGEVPVFAGGRFPASAMALSASQVLFLPRSAFIALISRRPHLAMNMLGELSVRLRQFTVQLEALSLKTVPSRLAAYLVRLSHEQRTKSMSEQEVRLPLSKGQLASVLGTIPETLSRIFSRMSAAGLIRIKGKTLWLLDAEGLTRLAAGEKWEDGDAR